MKKYILTLFAATVATAAMAQSHEHTWIGGTTAADGRSCTLQCIDPDCTATETHSHDNSFGCEYCGWALDMFNLKVEYTDNANHTVNEQYKLYGAEIKFTGAHAFDHYNHVTVDAVRDKIYEPEKSVDFKDIVAITGDAGYSTFRITTAKGNLDFPCTAGKTMDFRFWINPTQEDIFRLFNITPVDPAPDYMIYSHSVKGIDISLNEYDMRENPEGIKNIGNYEAELTHYSLDPECTQAVTPDQFIDAGTYYCWCTVSTATVGTRYVPLNDVLAGTFEIEKAEPLESDEKGRNELSHLYIYTAPTASATRQWSAEGIKTVAPFVEYNASRHDAHARQDLSFSTGLGAITLVYTTDREGRFTQSPINAGHYYVWAKTAEGKNYKALAPYYLGEFDIVKATVEDEAQRKALFRYTEKHYGYNNTERHAVLNPAWGVTGLGTISDSYRQTSDHTSAASPVQVGTYDVWASAEEGSNYFPVAPVFICEMTIDKTSADEVVLFIDALLKGKIVKGMDIDYDNDVDADDVKKLVDILLEKQKL